MLAIRRPEDCRYDVVSLGEVMLRLDPGNTRIRVARRFEVWEGGGEYNVARGLCRCFGLRAAVVTALVDNDVGRLIESLIAAGGVDASLLRWLPFDGVGRGARNGLNFTERGFGVRGAKGVSDRGSSAASLMRPRDIDWDDLFARIGVRWFHTGGIFAALSDSAAEVVLAAMQAARRHGTIVSYDLNYRPSLWNAIGGKEQARAVNRAIAPFVDVMLGNEEDFDACLGYETDGVDADLVELDPAAFEAMIGRVSADLPTLEVIATTLRGVRSASVNDWSAVAFARGEGIARATDRRGLEILDRVGGGDSFASGLIYALLEGLPITRAVDLGAAHGALAMTTPGDTSAATLEEVLALADGKSSRIQR